MKSVVILSVLLTAVAALPQGGYQSPRLPDYQSQTRVDSQGVTVTCERREVSPGQFEFSCANANPGQIVEEKTLWIPTEGSDQELLIRVPNYAFREIIRAGLQAGAAGGTNVRVHVARPQVESIVEGRFEQQGPQAPNVQVTYDGVQQRGEVHYGGNGEPYRSLSKQISEPSRGGRFRKSVY